MTSHLASLLTLRANVLKSLAVSIGVSTTGTKAQLVARITKSCCDGVGFLDTSMGGDGEVREEGGESREREVERGVGQQTGERTKRVLSIDVGIRNLAMCVIEVPNCGAVPAVVDKEERKCSRPRKKTVTETLPKIIAWERITIAGRPPEESETPEAQAPQPDIITPKRGKRKLSNPSFDESIYHLPSTLETDTTTSKKGRRKTPNPDLEEAVAPLPQTPETDVPTPKKGRRKTSNPGLDESISHLPPALGTDTTTSGKARRKTPRPGSQETIASLSQVPETDVTTPKKGRRKTPRPGSQETIASLSQIPETDVTTPKKGRRKTPDPDPLPPVKVPKARKKESFEPADYAILATNLVHMVLSRFSPDAILIERQRYRSFGSSSVLEWTIRVNMFEAMLHAVFYSVRNLRQGESTGRESPAAESVPPRRVNNFWIHKAGEKYLEVKKTSRRKKRNPDPDEKDLEKLDEGMDTNVKTKARAVAKAKLAKIYLVSDWIKSGDVVSLDQEVSSTVSDFVPPKRVRGKRPPKKENAGKLDDLADCLLQGMAWIRWEENRRSLAEGRLIPEFLLCGKK